MPSITPSALWLQALHQYSASYSKSSALIPSQLPPSLLVRPNRKIRSNNTLKPTASPLVSLSTRSVPSLPERLSLYETVARAHLFGAHGFQIHPNSISVLRQVRWDLMNHSTQREKTILMEKILELFTEASQAYLYDPIPSNAAEQQSLALEQVQCLVEARISGIPLSLHHLLQCTQIAKMDKSLSMLLLCEVEASQREQKKPSHINLNTMHGRRIHKTGITMGELGKQIERKGENNHQNAELVNMQLHCAVGLAGAGHPAEALRLCEMADNGDGRGFAFLVNRVTQQSRNGGQRAWEVANAVPLPVLFKAARVALDKEMQLVSFKAVKHVEGGSLMINYRGNYDNSLSSLRRSLSLVNGRDTDLSISQQKSCEAVGKKSRPGWLEGLLAAVLHRHRAAKGNGTSMKNWLLSFMKLFEEEVEKNSKGVAISCYHVEGNGIKVHSNKHEKCPSLSPLLHPEHIPRCFVEAFLSVCPPAAWHEAYNLVLHYNHAVSAPSRELSKSFHGTRCVPIGRLMTLLRLSGRPVEVLQLFYGSENLHIQPPDDLKDTCIKGPNGPMTMKKNVNVEVHLSEKAEAHPTLPRGIYLSDEDKRQPIIYNHAIMALREVGLWPQAMQFYKELSPNLKNIFTDWSMAKALLLVRSDYISVNSSKESPLDEETYQVGVSCVHHALGIPEAEKYFSMFPMVMKDSGDCVHTPRQRGISVPLADRVGVLESLALWAAVRGDWKEVCTLADHAPSACRYVRPIAIASILRQLQSTEARSIKKDLSEALCKQYQSLCDCPKRSVKQICLGLAMLVCTKITAEIARENKIDNKSDHLYNILDTARLESATVRGLNELVRQSQPVMNELITILTGYIRSIRKHQAENRERSTDAPPEVTFFSTSMDLDATRSCIGSISLARGNILNSTISLIHSLHSEGERRSSMSDQNDLLVNVLKRLGEEHGLSIARVAPAMISAGCSPDITLRFLT